MAAVRQPDYDISGFVGFNTTCRLTAGFFALPACASIPDMNRLLNPQSTSCQYPSLFLSPLTLAHCSAHTEKANGQKPRCCCFLTLQVFGLGEVLRPSVYRLLQPVHRSLPEANYRHRQARDDWIKGNNLQ